MSHAPLRTVATGFSFLEGPRWHDGRLWCSDFYTHRVLSIDADGRTTAECEVPQQPSGLGWLPDGRLLVVSMKDRRVLRREADGSLAQHADLSGIATGPCNDMVVDGQGRAWVGNFGFELMTDAPIATAALACVQPDGSADVAADGLYFPNGSMVTPDGRTLIVAESFGNRISAFDIGADGRLGPRRDWAVFGELPPLGAAPSSLGQRAVAPDGSTLDAEGCVWTADAAGKRVIRVAPGGRIVSSIATDPMGVFACTLGGDDGRTLFLCVAPDSSARRRAPVREAQLWSATVDVPGAGWP
ncbi:MAG: SMP-30/gluconolactonase/LRE family protein [Burkholderiaceae bacterium]